MATAKKKIGYASYRLNPLKKITDKAKKLYKTGRYKKWTDAVKAASKQTKIAGVPKKKAGLKKATAKKKVYKKPAITVVKAATPKAQLLSAAKNQLGKLFLQREMATKKTDKKTIGKKITEVRTKIKLISKL